MTIQQHHFTTGGFVLHKVHVEPYSGKFSAWFDCTGRLIDASHILRNGFERVPTDAQRRRLSVMGPVWLPKREEA